MFEDVPSISRHDAAGVTRGEETTIQGALPASPPPMPVSGSTWPGLPQVGFPWTTGPAIDEVVTALSHQSVFSSIPRGHLARLAGFCRMRTFEAGETLLNQGDDGESVFAIGQGRVKVERMPRALGEPFVVAEIGPGNVVGEMGILAGEPRSATVVAIERTVTVELHVAALAELLLHYPAVATALARSLSTRLRMTDERAETVRLEGALLAVRTVEHEINNDLTGISAQLQMMLRGPDLPASARAQAEEALRRVQKAVETVRQLRTLDGVIETKWGGMVTTIRLRSNGRGANEASLCALKRTRAAKFAQTKRRCHGVNDYAVKNAPACLNEQSKFCSRRDDQECCQKRQTNP